MSQPEPHVFLCRSRPYVFLPVNVGSRDVRLPKLAVVDVAGAVQHKGLHTKLWRTAPAGTIYRQFQDRAARADDGRRRRVQEQLVSVLKGLPPFSPNYAVNGDPLDCRADNWRLARHIPEARTFAASYKPGHVVEQLDGYNEALNSLRAFPGLYEAALDRKRTTKLTNEQTQAILTAALEGPMKGQSAESIAGYVADELHVPLHVNQIRAILKGRCLRQYGFDYAALAATRLGPRERALERWKTANLKQA